MARILTLLSLMFVFHGAGCTSMAKSHEQQKRYVYCNVYAASACFAVARGDVMTMRVPVDFVTYDLELVGGAKVLIYSGYNPTKVSASIDFVVKKYSTASGRYEHAKTSDGRHVITYTPNDTSSPLLQIIADQVGASHQEHFADFLSAFRSCKSDGYGVTCNKEDALFEEIAKDVFEK